MKNRPGIVTVVLTGLVVAGVVGCASPKSNKTRGEVVRLTLTDNLDNQHSIDAGAIGAVVGVVVDITKAKIEAEAKKLERQYGQFDYRSDFWSVKKTGATVKFRQSYSGVTIERFTRDLPEIGGKPAMKLECAFEPAKGGRMFLIKPILFQLNEAKAKIVNGDDAVNLSINVAIDAMWIDANQVSHQERIAFSTFEVMNYNLDKSEAISRFGGQRAGWFPGVPLSRGVDGKFPWETGADGTYSDGCFKISVLVTERDASKVKEQLETVAKFVGEHKDKIVEQAKKAAE